MESAAPSLPAIGTDPPAGERYLLLADISGYTGFMAGVEQVHGVDLSGGIPAAYSMLGDLLDTIIVGVEPDFAVVKLEGDAVFAAAPASSLDGHGDRVARPQRDSQPPDTPLPSSRRVAAGVGAAMGKLSIERSSSSQ